MIYSIEGNVNISHQPPDREAQTPIAEPLPRRTVSELEAGESDPTLSKLCKIQKRTFSSNDLRKIYELQRTSGIIRRRDESGTRKSRPQLR